jgi:hypothetical protein
MLCELHDLGT